MERKLTTELEEMVAIGAAVAANCEPCVRHHIGKAREAGLDDEQLRAAIAVAKMVKDTPARAVLEAADRLLATPATAAATPAAAASPRRGCCG